MSTGGGEECPLVVGPGAEVAESSSLAPVLEIRSSCDFKKFSSVFSSLSYRKENILSSAGFGGLLKIPRHEQIDENLTLWLYNKFDDSNFCLDLDGGVRLPITELDVHLIFPIPFHGRSVKLSSVLHLGILNAFLPKILGESMSSSLNMPFLEEIVKRDYGEEPSSREIDAFKIACVLCSMCYLLAPEKSIEFPTHLISNFVQDVKPQDLNWAHHVLTTIGRAAVDARQQMASKQNQISLFGCSLLLQVFYLDNMNFGPATPYHILLPRSSAYSPKLLHELAQLDCTGTYVDIYPEFGRRQVRDDSEVCYSRGWTKIPNVPICQETASLNECLQTIEILSHGLQEVERFVEIVNEIKRESRSVSDALFMSARDSYQNIRYRFKDYIHSLSTKAAATMKRRNMIVYHNVVPLLLPSISHKRFYTESSDHLVMKRHKPQASSDGGRMVIQPDPAEVTVGYPQSNLGIGKRRSNAISADWKLVSNHSNFGTSCFELGFFHPDVAKHRKSKAYAWMCSGKLRSDELNRDWIKIKTPVLLEMSGHAVQYCMKMNGHFSVTLVDVIMLIWKYLDDEVYNYMRRKEQVHKRWRHFLPASFAEQVLGNRDYLNSSIIRSAFIGPSLGYDVENCQMIILPVCLGENWSSYFWDFKFRTITVLDPQSMAFEPASVVRKHQHIVKFLHKALFNCIGHFFSGWDIAADGWSHVYRTDIEGRAKVNNSGLYTVHYCRAFSGEDVVFPLKEPTDANLSDARGEIIYHLFTYPFNEGYKPIDLMKGIVHSSY